MSRSAQYVVWFSGITKDDLFLVGEKGVNLGEMVNANFPIPTGFIISSNAYYHFIKENKLDLKIKHLLSTGNFDNLKSLHQISNHIRKLIELGIFSDKFVKDVVSSYRKLREPYVWLMPSITVDSLDIASFVGNKEVYLNFKGDAVLLEKIKKVWSSLFDARAILYRHQQKIDQTKIGIAIVVQELIKPDSSGILSTIDPLTNDKSKIVIEAITGNNNLVYKDNINHDYYYVLKKDFSIINKHVSFQKNKQKITDEQIIKLAKIAKDIENYYYFPQDVEWIIKNNKISIIQIKPITTINQESYSNEPILKQDKDILLKGCPVSSGIASGPVRIIQSLHDLDKIMPGDVLVCSGTNQNFVTFIKKASAVIADDGGRTSHVAIISRELGIPAVVGTRNAILLLKNGNIVTVNGSKGEIYKGSYTNLSQNFVVNQQLKTATKLYISVAEPELAEEISQKNIEGVGLLKAEYIITKFGIHPKKVIKDGKQREFIDKLSNDIVKFCKFFDSRPVIYRISNLKSDEYQDLIGGNEYEQQEQNPMFGFRGAFRYIHDPETFKLELDAIKKVREEMGFKNLWIMIPYIRSVEELINVKKIINETGLERSSTFKLWIEILLPSNVIMLEKFIQTGIDGISIGLNELTTFITGTDKENFEVSTEFNETNPATLWAIEQVIKTAQKNEIPAILCMDLVPNSVELIKNLISWGITGISVLPDAIEKTRKIIYQTEKEYINR